MSIAGNYNMHQAEINVVKDWLTNNGISFLSVIKYTNANDADVIVTLANEKCFTVEVKEESAYRINNYNDLGIDYISVCKYKQGVNGDKWKGSPKLPSKHESFINDLNEKSPGFKWGKVKYSKADIWLFFCRENGAYKFIEGFEGTYIKSPIFFNYLVQNCKFTVNNKPTSQLSYGDSHDSATFFINRRDPMLVEKHIKIHEFINNL